MYDEYGNLSFTLPPKLSERIISGGVLVGNRTQLLDALGFQYRHDHRNREVQKKIPGKSREFIAYDNLDRVIATGPIPNPFLDGSGMGWLHTKYDAFDRVVYTLWVPGVVSETTRARLELPQTHLSESPSTSATTIDGTPVYYSNQVTPRTGKLLSVYYYDDYRFPWAPSTFSSSILAQSVHYKHDTNKPKGLPTGSWIRVLENQQGAHATTTYLLYDNKSRVIRQYEKNYLGGYTQLDSKYDFIGTTLQTQTTHKRTSNFEELSVLETFEYTQENRLLTHTHKINAEPTKYLSEFRYDALGQPITNYIEGSSSPLQKIDYKYNIRGWLTNINNVTNLATSGAPQDLFAFKINYNQISTSNAQVRPMYNGNIAETSWRTSSDNIRRKYEYAYDDLDRLLGAYFNIPGTAVQGSYDEYLSYDSNGNILTLERYGEREDATLPMLIDDLKYGYDIGNKLLNVTDEEAHPSGFNDGNKHTQTNLPDFEYDVAGNLTRDRNKGITNITHNHLHQPQEIEVSKDTLSGSITYIYDAEGNKLQKQVMENQHLRTTEYLNGFQYIDGKLDFIPTAEGYVKAVNTGSTTEYHYVYHYTDHLGNIRLSYGRDPETNEVAILKESHYYPFGLQHNGYVGTHRTTGIIEEIGGSLRVGLIPVRNYLDDSYRYTFGGKEEQPELGLNWVDHHARNYMPDIVRTMTMDPLADKFVTLSPYSFLNNSPLRYTDPTGMATEEWVKKDGKYFWDDRVVDQATAEEHHGEEAKHIGVNKTVSTVVNGEKVDSVTLNEDGSVTKNGKTLSENSAETFTNEHGSTFQPRQTVGGYWQVSAGFAFFGGFGASFGKVYDAVGDSKYYFNIDGNIGYGAGVGLDGGIAVPTGSNQFLADDFGGNSGSYNAGATIHGVDANFHRGGSVEKSWNGREKVNPFKFGDMDRGYRTIQSGIGRGAGGRVGGMYSYGTTKIF